MSTRSGGVEKAIVVPGDIPSCARPHSHMPPRKKAATKSQQAGRSPESTVQANKQTKTLSTNRPSTSQKPAATKKQQAAPKEKKLPELPVEIWCYIFGFATEWKQELDISTNSFRALAALGVPAVFGSHQEEFLKQKKLAQIARLSIPLVCKSWKACLPYYIFRTISIKNSADLRMLMIKFLSCPRPVPSTADEPIQLYSAPGRTVTRLELNFEVSKLSTEEIGSSVRGFIRGCNNLTIVEAHTTHTTSKRAPSPIEISLQAAVEIPFAVALGNSQVHSIKYVHFSKDSLASFTLPWVINLLNRLPNLEILSLADYPDWENIPLPPNAKPDPKSTQGNHHGRSQVTNESDEDEDDSEADDEEDPLPVVTFQNMHTLDVSRLGTTDIKRSIALSRYLGQWTVPSVVNLGLSIYNHEAIPVALLRQFSDKIKRLYLHHFYIPPPKPPRNDPADAPVQTRNNNANAPVQTTADRVADKKFDLPSLKYLHVVVRKVSNEWPLVFTCPNATHYMMSFASYHPTPFDPNNSVCEVEKDIWESSFKKVTQHFHLCQDVSILPELQEVRLVDHSFKVDHLPSSHVKYWLEWETKLKKRDVAFVDRDGLTWSEARAGMPSYEELKKTEDARKAEKELAKAEAAKAAKVAKTTETDADGTSETTRARETTRAAGSSRRQTEGQTA